jgi:putative transposase
MLKNAKLARAISDIGFGEIARQAKYKAILYGTKIIEADRWFPSSKMCSVCDFVHVDLRLSDRTWTCPNCGITHDRDINAAKNLKRLATETALPVASRPAMECTSDMPMAVYGGKVTPVSYDVCPQEVSGQEEKTAVSIIPNNHICAPFQ